MALATSESAPALTYYHRPRLTPEQYGAFRAAYSTDSSVGELVLLARAIARENDISGREAALLMREAASQMYAEGDPRRAKYQVDVYAGCEHGLVMDDYQWILQERPDFLYVSDLAGSTFEGATKVIYYNRIINAVRASVGQENLRNVSSEEIHEMVLARKDAMLQTALDGYRELFEYVQTFAPGEVSMPSPGDADGVLAWIARYTPISENHGTWMSSLSKSARGRILEEIGIKTRIVVDKLRHIKTRDTQVVLVPGNWDGQESMELIANGDGTEDARITDFFNTQEYARAQGLEVLSQLSVVETDTTYTIAAPFFWLKYDFEQYRRSPEYQRIIEQAQKAKEQGKLIVCFPHAALFQAEASGDNQKVAVRTLQLMRDMDIDEVAFGHFHDKTWKDRYGTVVDPRETAVVYQFKDDQRSFGTYVPKGDIAVAVRRRKRKQQIPTTVLPARIR